ncbi:DUF3570 domain-containing protein [Flavobacterium sp.]|uniref:DUF3570 domain-containing protein n=3 Tax=Flavobacterium sp. TaxID=239 RepID=UPI0040471CC3
MKNKIVILFVLFSCFAFSQESDSTKVTYKKRVLEGAEVDFLASYYKQDGVHSAVSGGIGSEKLTDFASNIVVAMPLNDDDVLTIDVGLSAYTSASSSNINPFNASGASGGGGGDDDDKVEVAGPFGTPWQASSGASASDVYASVVANYSHSSDDRNFVWNADVAFSNEYDYTSVGFGGGIAKLFNDKNSEVSLKVNVYLDQWRPIYPTELHEYAKYGSNFLNSGFFSGVTVLDQNGAASTSYLPSDFTNWKSSNRNSYAASFGFSQVATKKMQFSVFFDLLSQSGMLSTPYQRVYFTDKANYYIGQSAYIPYYTNPSINSGNGVYQLADDIERLPGTRFKIPVGARLNYYLNERVAIRTYYRYYWDDWGVTAHTASIEIPIKLSDKFTVFPSYRYYTQGKAKYFAPFETHLSTEKYYTSDYDLSTFNATQYGVGVGYTDIFTNAKIWKFGIKNIDFRFSHYDRNDGLNANIVTFGIKFVEQ